MPNKPLPQFVAPMAAASVKEPFDSTDWIFEPKLDGYRAIMVIDSTGKARLWSRNHLPLEPKFPTIQEAINKLNLRSTILDGEIVALDRDGVPRFQLLQQWQKRPTAPVVLYLFDLLWSEGARKMLQTAIENEVLEYLEAHRDRHTDAGQRLIVRNGHHPERELVTGGWPDKGSSTADSPSRWAEV